MRSFLTTTLLLAGLARHVVGHSCSSNDEAPVSRRRKSLGFGPEHPHSFFHSSPYQIKSNGFVPRAVDSDPMDVTKAFLDENLKGLAPQSQYVIRDDSYTDKNTGVTHVYVRQLFGGLEVVDANMNLNIKDGMVLSWGSSFYPGAAPSLLPNTASPYNPHLDYCLKLNDELQGRRHRLEQQRFASSFDQVSMGGDLHGHDSESMELLQHLHTSNCATAFDEVDTEKHGDLIDRREALLQFMIAVTPNPKLAEDIKANWYNHLFEMSTTSEHHLVGSHETLIEHLSNVPDTVNPVKSKLAYIQVSEGGKTELVPVWRFEVEMQDNWYEASVSAVAPFRIISVVDWASDSNIPVSKKGSAATYNVFKWGVNDPSEGERTIEEENFDALASPVGWHSLPYANDPSASGKGAKGTFHNTTTTWGNNVFAHEDWEGQNNWIDNYRPDGGKSLEFDYSYDPKNGSKADALAEAKRYINATITQLFYTSNMVHDLYYRYGFDEVSGNFQQHNFGRGGKEGDAVIANAQDGSGFNNANFMTPPDGQNGRCRMYLWNTAMPYRDGDLEAGIVIHELSHGLSTRLTGGPANSGCLGWGESGGMGEGWGDFLATVVRSTSTYSDYPMGAWAANRVGGIRNYPYSMDEEINPSNYKTLDKPGYWGVHAIGEVWAQILWNVNQRLIAKHGYSDTLFPPKPLDDGSIPTGDFYRPVEYTASGQPKPLVPKHGNTLITQLVFNGMKLQPCNPTFFKARDAIIQADQVLTVERTSALCGKASREKGLGPDARIDGQTPWGGGVRTNDFEAPLACQED